MTSGQITEEKRYATNAFLWEKYRAFWFNVRNSIISFHFEQLRQEMDFLNKGYATNAFLWSKFNKNGFHVRKVLISQFLQKMSINYRIFKQK